MAARRGAAVTLARAAKILEDGFLVTLLVVMIVLAVVQIALRNLLDAGLLWADPLLRLMVLWLGLLGAAVATRDDRQISVDVLSRLLPPRGRAAARVVVDCFTAAVAGFLAFHAARLVRADHAADVVAFAGVPAWVAELILPAAFAVIAFRYLRMAWGHLREAAGRPA